MKKKWIPILVLLGSLAFGGCATPPKATVATKATVPADRYMEFGHGKVKLPLGIPDFSSFQLIQKFPVYAGKNFIIVGGEGVNPANSREFILLVVVVEKHGDDTKVFLLAFQHSLILEGKDPTSRAFVDKAYLETGIYSGVFVEVEKVPDLKKFITLKTQQLLPKTGI